MVRGPRKHLKRLNAPKSWMLDKMGGTWAPRPSSGPHKLRECIPVIVMLRNRLKYALNRAEVVKIMKQRLIRIDGKVRTDDTYPLGIMDVLSIDKMKKNFRILYDTKSRFILQSISEKEANFKLCRIRRRTIGARGVPQIVTNDGRTIRFPDPSIKVGDSIKFNLKTKKIVDILPFEQHAFALITGGASRGRIGKVVEFTKQQDGLETVKLRDENNATFVTKKDSVFIISKKGVIEISLPKDKGIKRSPLDSIETLSKSAALPAPTVSA